MWKEPVRRVPLGPAPAQRDRPRLRPQEASPRTQIRRGPRGSGCAECQALSGSEAGGRPLRALADEKGWGGLMSPKVTAGPEPEFRAAPWAGLAGASWPCSALVHPEGPPRTGQAMGGCFGRQGGVLCVGGHDLGAGGILKAAERALDWRGGEMSPAPLYPQAPAATALRCSRSPGGRRIWWACMSKTWRRSRWAGTPAGQVRAEAARQPRARLCSPTASGPTAARPRAPLPPPLPHAAPLPEASRGPECNQTPEPTACGTGGSSSAPPPPRVATRASLGPSSPTCPPNQALVPNPFSPHLAGLL